MGAWVLISSCQGSPAKRRSRFPDAWDGSLQGMPPALNRPRWVAATRRRSVARVPLSRERRPEWHFRGRRDPTLNRLRTRSGAYHRREIGVPPSWPEGLRREPLAQDPLNARGTRKSRAFDGHRDHARAVSQAESTPWAVARWFEINRQVVDDRGRLLDFASLRRHGNGYWRCCRTRAKRGSIRERARREGIALAGVGPYPS